MSDKFIEIPSPARLRLDSRALVENWQNLDKMSGRAKAGAAVKANAYGLAAVEVDRHLQESRCTDFFVANCQKARVLQAKIKSGSRLSVLSGVRQEQRAYAISSAAKPVI